MPMDGSLRNVIVFFFSFPVLSGPETLVFTAFLIGAKHIESHLKSIYYGCSALFVSNYDVIPKVTSPDSNLVQMLLHKTVKQAVDDPIDEMINAISLKNSEQFETALIKRIKEIRRFDIDHFLCMDIWSMGLIKEAKKNGLHFHSDYIEVDCKDR